jgi:hypothetical protein
MNSKKVFENVSVAVQSLALAACVAVLGYIGYDIYELEKWKSDSKAAAPQELVVTVDAVDTLVWGKGMRYPRVHTDKGTFFTNGFAEAFAKAQGQQMTIEVKGIEGQSLGHNLHPKVTKVLSPA